VTSEEQQLINEAFVAVKTVETGCPDLSKYARRAIVTTGDLLQRYSTVPEPDSAAPLAPVIKLVPDA
jgi:hypothetical protein